MKIMFSYAYCPICHVTVTGSNRTAAAKLLEVHMTRHPEIPQEKWPTIWVAYEMSGPGDYD